MALPKIEVIPLDQFRPQTLNANAHTARGHAALTDSVQRDGWIGALTVAADQETFDGSDRLDVAAEAGFAEVVVIESDGTRPIIVKRTDIPTAADLRAMRLGVAANRIAALNLALKPIVLQQIQVAGVDLAPWWHPDELAAQLAQAGTELLDAAPAAPSVQDARKTLADRFGVPPFSVLDARQGYWQARKRAWIALGIQSELGRGDGITCPGDAVTEPGLNYYRNRAKANPDGADGGGLVIDGDSRQSRTNGLLGESEQARSHYHAASLGPDGKTRRGDGTGRGLARCYGQDLMRGEHTVGENGARLTWVAGDRDTADLDETSRKILAAQPQSGTSIFDPVLCELVYRWFAPPAAAVLDPFAGGSVRGIVAALLGHAYTGLDLRAEQIAANEAQAAAICPESAPRWITGDSREIAALAPGRYDLIFTCPPYADLEVYSDDPRDLSTLDYPAFVEAYRAILAAACSLLAPDRFAAVVVGDVRDGKGFYRNLVSATIDAFQDAGLRLYNEAILVTAVGSLPIRVGKQFGSYRKLGKTHQNVLVFYNGDPRRIKDFGEVEMGEPDAFGPADDGEAGP